MEYMKKKETRFDAHGHWNTVHDAEITLDDALAMIDCIEKQYTHCFDLLSDMEFPPHQNPPDVFQLPLFRF